MITEHDLQEAIAECEGQRNPTVNTCLKLAAFYTIRDKMFPAEQDKGMALRPMYSYARSEEEMNMQSEFMQAISNVDQERLMHVMDELMSTVKIVIPKLYDGVMMKLTE